MSRRHPKPKTETVREATREAVAPSHLEGLHLAATLIESLGGVNFLSGFGGGLHGGMPGARRGGMDSPAITSIVQLQVYRGIARWAYERNEYYGGLIDRLMDYTCGRGYTYTIGQRRFKPKPGVPLPEPIQYAQDCWDDFAHADGWRSRQREEVKRVFRDGESFRRIFPAVRMSALPQCRFVEPEHIVPPERYSGIREWDFGVLALAHDAERHLAYFVKAHADYEGEVVLAAGVTWDDIPEHLIEGLRRGAGSIIHRKESRSDRAVKRGLPLFWGGTDGLEQAESLLDNLTGVAAYLSTITHYRQHAPGVGSSELVNFTDRIKARQDADLSGAAGTVGAMALPVLAGLTGWVGGLNAFSQGGTNVATGPRVVDITNGLQMVPPPVQGNITGFLSVLAARIRAACVLAGAPEYLGSGDASNNNFASIKEAGSPFVVATEGRQQDVADSDVRVAETVICYGGLDFPGLQVTVTPPAVAIRSDNEKATTTNTKIAGGWMSPQDAIREDGRDPEQTLVDIVAWKDALPDSGPALPVPDGFGNGS